MKDGNQNNWKDEDGNLLCQLSPHPNKLQYLYILYPEIEFLTSITVDKLINHYGEAHQQDPTQQAHFEIMITQDQKYDCVCIANFLYPTDHTHYRSANSVVHIYRPWEIDPTNIFFAPTAAPSDLFHLIIFVFLHPHEDES